jgi:uncharacterized protein (DUF2126 family)
MSIQVGLRHVTSYTYDRRVALAPQLVRLRPAPHCRTPVLSYSMQVLPREHWVNWQQDPQGNHLARLVFPEPVRELRIEIDLVADLTVYNPFDFFLEPHAERFPFQYAEWQRLELQPYLRRQETGEAFEAFVRGVDRSSRRTIDFLVDVNRQVQRDVRYLIRMEPGVQTAEETLRLSSGSCRDSTWLLVQLLRRLGLAARFVSGYLIQLVPDERPLEGPAGPDRDFTDLHAWCEAYLPGAGWVGLDPTSGLLAGEGHLPLACAPDPASAAPVSGAVEACEVSFGHSMAVQRVMESPRVTLPYREEQWQSLLALGHAVDRKLQADDVRLTMGGEPTFVSASDREAPEWSTAALGGEKRRLAVALLQGLRRRYAPQGAVHFGQGKWYPGEPLPRWALACYWRRDGEPVWTDSELIADESVDYGAGPAESERFARSLAQRLGVGASLLLPAHEDIFYYLWRERHLPVNVDPFDSRLDDELERERLLRLFSGPGLSRVVGHALPLAPLAGGGWQSGPWFLRGERLYLIPGDSPMGYRLPLDSLPWAAAGDRPPLYERDPLEARDPLPRRAALEPRLTPPEEAAATGAQGQHHSESAKGVVRTALCVEPRGGRLHVFLPPLRRLEHYLELVVCVEDVARATDQPVVLEGYPPPGDPRLVGFQITPDPGVIEVNVQPVAGWDELVDLTTTLYEEAKTVGLTTEKFMLDGRHTGTGGGNHLVLGGATAADSPFLRRPDLLGSLVSYWHNHPSLSYLFAGLFIGPTSQAPRVDEARHDSLFELEIALEQLPEPGAEVSPWLVDRLFRHLLVDATGNTHRAEFCIDKLYSPDSIAGRQGLVELRGFEMPPHARMSLAQQLLVRSLVARFWREPYREPLVRWGTQLHDRFLLPFFVWQDFEDVLQEQGRAGYALDPQWFAPHFEFRFPRHGELAARGVHLTLRQALEPWQTLGEESGSGGTSRYVDSSVERLEVLARGLTGERFVITCNGRAVPLHPAGRAGEAVAGVRYRAWQPPSCLHPTIPVHAPLTFDLVDTWLGRSLAGCQYHVKHPGGLTFERFPVNGSEAESRRRTRFLTMGHTPGPAPVLRVPRDPEFPHTLDLRRPVESGPPGILCG